MAISLHTFSLIPVPVSEKETMFLVLFFQRKKPFLITVPFILEQGTARHQS